MTSEQLLVLAILAATVAAFLWGRWRHDVVALGSLLACVLAGLVPGGEAFAGFGHPAVITVACVLILSRGLLTSGAVDALARRILPGSAGPAVTIVSLTGLAAVLSAFMNNVGALALLMPVAVQSAARQGVPPGRVLMPLSFGSILGGMTTLIGTPPNLIVAGFRAETGGEGFGMFDFTPVGVAVAAAGIALVTLGGWRLVPKRERADASGFDTGTYLTEARVSGKGKAAGMTLREIEEALREADAQVVGLIREEIRVPGPHPSRRVRAGDILVVEAEPATLASALSSLGLELEAKVQEKQENEAEKREQEAEKDGNAGTNGKAGTEKGEGGQEGRDDGGDGDGDGDGDGESGAEAGGAEDGDGKESKPSKGKGSRALESDEVSLIELVVMPGSALAGRSAATARLRGRFGINLLAVSRQGRRSMSRLRAMALRPGDVMLMQGAPESVAEFAAAFGCAPLAKRSVRIPDRRRALAASGILVAAVGGAAFGLVPAAIAFALGALVAVAVRVVSPRAVYEAIDWPVIVLLGALIPVAGAMAETGAADVIARWLVETVAQGRAVVALGLILVVTMTLSDFMNNAATAAVMCQIAVGTAVELGVSADPFLMAVAVGASCAFLTPIGHQNNTLILGPGGFHFGDYWRLGLPMEILVVAVGVPMILLVWPLG